MKKTILLLSICNSHIFLSHAQPKLVNESIKYKDSSIIFSFYKNKITVPDTVAPPFQLRAKRSTITNTGDPHRFWVSSRAKGWDTLTVIQNKKIVLQQSFRFVPEPHMVAQWGTLTDSVVKPAEIIAHQKMIVTFGECSCDPDGTIGSFVIRIQSDNSNIPIHLKSFTVNGNRLSPEIIAVIRKLYAGDKIIFSNIRSIDNSSYPRLLDPFSFIIK